MCVNFSYFLKIYGSTSIYNNININRGGNINLNTLLKMRYNIDVSHKFV